MGLNIIRGYDRHFYQGLELNGVEVHFVDWKSNSIQQVKQLILELKLYEFKLNVTIRNMN